MEMEPIHTQQSALGRPFIRGSVGVSHSAPVSPKIPLRETTEGFGPIGLPGARIGSKSTRTTRASSPIAVGPAPTVSRRSFHPDASLVLVGIRGCGKRSLGFIAATALGRRYITEDHYFQSVTGLSRQDYLQTHGSQEFHTRDVEVSLKMLEDNKVKCVIECGLGSLTSNVQDYLKQYALHNPVVYLLRDMEEIKRLLKLGDRSARLLMNGDPTHRRCSNFEFYNLEESAVAVAPDNGNSDRRSPTYSFKLKEAQEDFSYFVRFITGNLPSRSNGSSPFSLAAVPVDRRPYTHALVIRSSAYDEGKINLAQLESGGDVIEIWIDRWSSKSTRTLSKLVADVRRKIDIPIIFSPILGQPGIDSSTYITILEQGLRLGVEYLSVNLTISSRQILAIIASKGYTRVIGTFQESDASNLSWDDHEWLRRYERAEMLGCDIVRLLKIAITRDDNDDVGKLIHKVRGKAGSHPPLVAYNIGPLGRTSLVFNRTFTPVTCLLLGNSDTVGNGLLGPQISAQDAIRALFDCFVFDPLNFYIVGANVSDSLSPAMHNAAYRQLGMRHSYKTRNITSLSDIEQLAQDRNFGGVAVVQPWKVRLFSKVASLSRHAEAIGAVNTIVPLRAQADGSVAPVPLQAMQRNRAGRVAAWFGDNTDWIGITVCLKRNLSPRNVVKPLKTTGLVIGAGGMARAAVYAMLQMGCRNIFIYNRTTENAEILRAHFNAQATAGRTDQESATELVRVFSSTEQPWPAGFDMPTMIVSCVTEENLYGKPAANFQMPLQWLQSPSGGVVIEMAYARLSTPLLNQIKQFRQDQNTPWVMVNGLETLPEQAIAQFELMTGRRAPRNCMRDAIRKSLTHAAENGT